MRLKKFFNLRRIIRDGRILLLAYDQGIEHGPTDFNDKNVDPNYIIDIASQGGYTGLVLQKVEGSACFEVEWEDFAC